MLINVSYFIYSMLFTNITQCDIINIEDKGSGKPETAERLILMKKNVILYTLFDETDTNHCILIGIFKTLNETKEAAKSYKKDTCSEVILQAYEVIRNENWKLIFKINMLI